MSSSPAASHLALFMTRGVSLAQWERQGLFEREVALYRALRAHVGDLSIVTYGDERDLAFRAALPGIEILCNRWGLPAALYALALPWLHRQGLAAATVLKTNQMKGALAALRVRGRTGAPLIARCGYMWSLAAAEFRGGWRGRLNYAEAVRTERRVFAQADAISVTTAAAREAVTRQYGVAAERVRVIPNYVLDEFFAPPPNGGPGRGLLFVGRLEVDKDPRLVLEAAHGLDSPVTFIGRGSLQPALAARAAALGVPVDFIPSVPHRELPARLQAAAVFVLPSPREGHPKTLIEAMAAGRAVLGRDAPGIRELIRPSETGLLAAGTPAAFHEAAARLLADADLRQRLGRNAREFAREHFSFDKVLRAELSLLHDVTQPRQHAA